MKNKKIVYLLSSMALVAITGAFVFKLVNTSEYEKNVNKIVQMDESERQAQLDKVVEDGMMNVQYTPHIIVEGNICKNFNIKNIENNKYPIKFKIIGEDDSILYQSDRIDLGYELNGLEFGQTLEKGTYSCKINIVYDFEGNVSSTFPITIKSI